MLDFIRVLLASIIIRCDFFLCLFMANYLRFLTVQLNHLCNCEIKLIFCWILLASIHLEFLLLTNPIVRLIPDCFLCFVRFSYQSYVKLLRVWKLFISFVLWNSLEFKWSGSFEELRSFICTKAIWAWSFFLRGWLKILNITPLDSWSQVNIFLF